MVYGVNHRVLKASHTVDLQRLVHDQLPGAGRQGAARQRGASAAGVMTTIHSYTNDQVLTDVYPQGPAPRALGDHVADPDQDRRRRGRGSGAAGAQWQARRLRGARAHHQRVAGGSELHGRTRHDGRRKSIG